MKRVLKTIKNTFIVLIGLVFGILIFLFVYFEIQNHRLKKQSDLLEQKSQIRLIDADSINVNSGNHTLKLLPVPRKLEMQEGIYRMPKELLCSVNDSLNIITDDFVNIIPDVRITCTPKGKDMSISYRSDLPEQGYSLDIRPEAISIEYTHIQGLHYALVSLKVLTHNYKGQIPCVIIEDFPDLPVRGVMLDISRNKVPTLQTLKEIADLLGDLKYNHFELYIEGFSFAYPSFKSLWNITETPVTGEEIRELDAFCRSRFIDLVPNQNSLGHMMDWLATEEYGNLAECPNGYKLMGLINMKGTIDPSNPRSIQLISAMTGDLLPNFSSDKFNVNLDEPFELGKGKNKKLAKKTGVEEIYLQHTLKVYDLVKKNDRKMLMWGDIVLRHPEILKKLPGDITLLDWGYESGYPFERNCKTLQSSGLSYMVCPGTSSWTSITGRTKNMLGNIASAAANGVKYEASGLLLTDWGDMGHWQYLPVSYAGYSMAAALSWNAKSMNELPLTSFLNSYIFKDDRQIMGDLVLDLGRYAQFEEIPVPNMTTTMLALQFGLKDKVMINALYEKISGGLTEIMQEIAPEMIVEYLEKFDARQPFDFSGLFAFLDENEALLNSISLQTPDSMLIFDEYHNAIRLLKVGANLQYYIQKRNEMTLREQKMQLQTLSSNLKHFLSENKRLWMLRNKPGGYERSIASLNSLLAEIDKQLEYSEKSFIQRGLYRFIEKITTGATVLYLRIL